MAIAKLPKDVEKFIAQGGSTTQLATVERSPELPKESVQDSDAESCRIILRLPKGLLKLLDKERNKKTSKPYRNQFILELLDCALKELKQNI
ncbi:hypothetical protein H0X48_05970 [Candidatus Dependentiae bacterium]|nr:hypothetical protein [Candidatus Dependentiae bacterium]